jgi:hypothetical protein
MKPTPRTEAKMAVSQLIGKQRKEFAIQEQIANSE